MLVVVTGGAGFIGSHLVDALIERGDEVRVLDDLSAGLRENVNPKATLHEGSITDVELLDEVMSGAELVFHEAARGSVPRSVADPLGTDHANVHGTLAVLHAAHLAGVRRFVAASSSSVYGGLGPRPTPESTPLTPRSPYAVSKMTGEHYLRVYAELHGMETVALRYFNVYGPRQRPDSAYAAVIPLFIDALRQGRSPMVHGDGKQSRDFAFVSDVVRANILASEADPVRCSGNAYNVAGGGEQSLLEMLDILGDVLGTSVAPEFVEPRTGDVRFSYADLTAGGTDLGYSPTVSFADGLRQTAAWFSR
ncbi:MAG TPA: SDR family oxidoreductase [Acidimicrobiales bacterium]|jgi:UDP-glucose 4-epimerase